MKISTKGDYATRALQDLALHYNEGPVRAEGIARRQRLPLRYMEQLLLLLKRHGYVASKRGVRGGYYLAKPPGQITLGEVIRAMDGTLAPIFCVTEWPRDVCSQEPHCVLREVWAEVYMAVSRIVDTTTLEDICKRIRGQAEGDRGAAGRDPRLSGPYPVGGGKAGRGGFG